MSATTLDYTDELGSLLADEVRRGETLLGACKRVHDARPDLATNVRGLYAVAFTNNDSWRNRGQQGIQPFVDFVKEIDAAQAEYRDEATRDMPGSRILRMLAEQAIGPSEYITFPLVDGKHGADGEKVRVATLDVERLIADGKGHMLKSLKQGVYGPIYEFADGQSALDKLAKIKRLYEDGAPVKVDMMSNGQPLKSPPTPAEMAAAIVSALRVTADDDNDR